MIPIFFVFFLLVTLSMQPSPCSTSDIGNVSDDRQTVKPDFSKQLFTNEKKLKEIYNELSNGKPFGNISRLDTDAKFSLSSADNAIREGDIAQSVDGDRLKASNDGEAVDEDLLELLRSVSHSEVLEYLYSGLSIDDFIPKDKNDSEYPPLVSTAEGVVKGVRINRNGVRYSSFLGIPYVSPPVRFQAAKPAVPWTGIRDATQDGNACIQKVPIVDAILGSEDCLYLNIHTPSTDAVGLPVLVIIHGGAFKQLTGNSYIFGPGELMKENTIHVSFNYRLGPLGFLSTKTAGAPGNAGMKDMIEALRWVQRNVHMFGGDPQKVTLYGVSTGAAAIEYMTMSKMAKGLFSQTISQSCSALNYWAYAKDPLKYAYRLGRYLGSHKTGIEQLLKSLREAKAEDIIDAAEKLGADEIPTREILPFVPSVEDIIPGEETFLHDHPETILMSGDFIKVPSMIGFNELDGSEFVKLINNDPEYLNDIDDFFEYLMPQDLMDRLKYPKERVEVINRVKQFYLTGEKIGNSTVQQFVDMMGDSNFFYGLVKSVLIRLKTSPSPIYLWQFAHDGDYSIFKKFYQFGLKGAAHGDDLGYLFGTPFFIGEKRSKLTKEVSLRMATMVANFMKSGNPTPFTTPVLPITWQPIQSAETMEYMKLTDKMELLRNPFEKRFLFWKNLYDSVK